MKHTPGPWHSKNGTVIAGDYASEGEPDLIVRIESENASADARLIAQAPDAFDLIRDIADHFQGTDAPLGTRARAWLQWASPSGAPQDG